MFKHKGKLTRQKARKLGISETRSKNVEEAHGFKLQDSVLLSKCISSAATCSSCKSPTFQLKLYQDNSKRDGLAEHLFLKCSNSGIQLDLVTSQKLGGKSEASEMNRRSVIASRRIVQSALEKLCSVMNLSPQVNKRAYNRHMKKVKIGRAHV